jgi:uncharacterized membrane protein
MDRPLPVLDRAIATIEASTDADRLADRLEPVARILHESSARPVLRGEWLGHALHPLMTDVPLGCFLATNLVDLVGGRRGAPAAQRLLGIGLLAIPPTVATGMVDWVELAGDKQVRRAGAVHAAANGVATLLYLASWRHRRRGHRGRGVVLALAGTAVASGAGYLGGHLAFALGAGRGRRGDEARGGSGS